ncbi:serine/threonine-protein phosphatase [Candidatus Saganbacteria bacterium]|nr:serine/threonine-protein phosphatase [Candidatus Saganbacteria bacterium]
MALSELFETDLNILTELERDSIKALTLPVKGEEGISQLATAIISRLAPSPSIFSDDAFTVRHSPPKPSPPPPRQDDLRDLQELQALLARKPEIKQRTERLTAAARLIMPYLAWGAEVEHALTQLNREYDGAVTLADRAAVLHGKTSKSAPAYLTGIKFFELPQFPTAAPGRIRIDTELQENEIAAVRARFREIIMRFSEMKSAVETYVLKLAAGSVPKINIDEEVKSMQTFLESLRSLIQYLEIDRSFLSKPENKYQLKGTANLTIAAQFSALQDLIFEIGQAYGAADRNYSEALNFNNSARGKMLQMLEQLKAYSDLSGIKEAVAALEKTAEKMNTDYTNAGLKNAQEHRQAIDQVKAAFNTVVQLRPQVQPPQPVPPPAPAPSGAGPAPPEPPKILNYYFKAIGHCEELTRLRSTLSDTVRGIIEEFTAEQIADMKTQEPTQEDAILVADWALSRRNQVGTLSKEAVALLEKVQHCMEKYLAENFSILVIEPTVGTQYHRIQTLADQVGQEIGKYGEVLRVESLGFTDKDNKVVKKAKVVLGDGTVFTDRAFDTTGSAAPDSWSRVPPPALVAPSPGATSATLPSSPPMPAVPRLSLGKRVRGIGQRIWKGWLTVNGAVARFQNRVVRTVVTVAKRINEQVNRLGRWEDLLVWSTKELPQPQNLLQIDAFSGKKWVSSDTRIIKESRKNRRLVCRLSPDGDRLAEIRKVGSEYFLKVVGKKDVWINGSHVAKRQKINSGDVVLSGDHSFVIDILPIDRSFKRAEGVEWVAGGENGEIVVEHGALLSYRAGRTHNEDAAGHAWINEDEELFMIGDGMGGHAAGEIASLRLMETMVAEMRGSRELSGAIERASEIIYQESKSNPLRKGMGTTVVAALLNHKTKKLQMAWVGDSRGKYIPQDAAQEAALLTRDHTPFWTNQHFGIEPLAEKLPIEELRLEEMTRLENGFENDPMWKNFNHSITSVVGHPKKLVIHVVEMPFLPGPPVNYLLLSSDGLRRGLTERWITELVRQGGSPAAIARRLKDAALKLGTNDNVSIAVIPVPALDLAQLTERIFDNNK